MRPPSSSALPARGEGRGSGAGLLQNASVVCSPTGMGVCAGRFPGGRLSVCPSVRAEPGGAISAQGCNRIWEPREGKQGHRAGFVRDPGRFASRVPSPSPAYRKGQGVTHVTPAPICPPRGRSSVALKGSDMGWGEASAEDHFFFPFPPKGPPHGWSLAFSARRRLTYRPSKVVAIPAPRPARVQFLLSKSMCPGLPGRRLVPLACYFQATSPLGVADLCPSFCHGYSLLGWIS